MRKTYLIILIIIIFSFALAVYLYPQMPDKMASHWNVRGEVDGYLPKFWGLFLMPIILVVMFFLFLLIPRIDPLKANVEKFRKYFDWFIVLISFFLFYLYLLTIFWSKGARFNMGQVMMPALGILFFYCGVLISKSKRNWFVGIRTPWTLSSDNVWEKTHKIGAKLFKISGLIAILGTFFKGYILWFVLAPVLISTIYVVIYSYFEFQKEKKEKLIS